VSFYSSIVLAANSGVRNISVDAARSLLTELELLDSARGINDFCNLRDDISALFADDAARAQNRLFFCPDTISFRGEIAVLSNEGDFEGEGYSFSIHGNGYFYPWNLGMLREIVVRTPKLMKLRSEVEARFGGRFAFPNDQDDEAHLRERMIDGSTGWLWFGSESF
jgi:hypothetical protein